MSNKLSIRNRIVADLISLALVIPNLLCMTFSVAKVRAADSLGKTLPGRDLTESKIDEDNTLYKSVATKEVVLEVEAENGTTDIDFGEVKLKAGHTYVVFETATSTDDFVPRDDNPEIKNKHRVEHKDPSDKSQTVVVKDEPKPEIPDKPREPKPGIPDEPRPELPNTGVDGIGYFIFLD